MSLIRPQQPLFTAIITCYSLIILAAAAAKLLQLCPTLCDPTDSSPPGSPVPGILQTRTLEWVAISFSNAWKWKVKMKSLSRVQPSATLWTAAFQAPPSMGFSRREYWSGVPLPSPLIMLSYYQKLNTWQLPFINITANNPVFSMGIFLHRHLLENVCIYLTFTCMGYLLNWSISYM